MENAGGEKDDDDGSARERHVIRWESFLPRRSLRVLLVEHDDSTRHVVTALLRKCSYRVAGVADGMKAWEVMKEKRYGFDLVLTEVETPTFSGIELLSMIMSAEECKNIPVIMMSSHDSVNVVLKCMLKGAVDFLVKPVRKNELRNLWQHVWRRHCLNRDLNASDNNTASNQISVNADDTSKTSENSGENNAAQSSGSKHDREIESTHMHGADLQAEEVHTSGAEENQLNSDKDTTNQASEAKINGGGETREYKPVSIRGNVTLPILEASLAISSQQYNPPCTISSDREENLDIERSVEGNHNCPKSFSQNNDPHDSVQNMIVCVQPQLKGKHVLKHSVASAFSRYGDSKIQSTFHKTFSSDLCIRTEVLVDKCHTPVSIHGTDDEKNTPFSYTEQCLPCPEENEGGDTTVYLKVSSNYKESADLCSLPQREKEIDHAGQASSTVNTENYHPLFGFIPLPIPVGSIPYQSLYASYGGILQPVFYPETSWAQQSLPSADRPTLIVTSDHSIHPSNQPVNLSPSVESHHHEVTNHHGHRRRAIDVSEPGYSIEMLRSPMELRGWGNNVSGGTADVVGNTVTPLESWNESRVQACNIKGIDCERARREAALIKFRMKRKDRCFVKKVRYYNRKTLAERRPRIKGQFVRQKFPDSTTEAEN